jgi:hypothetical protein
MKFRINEDYYHWYCEWCDSENRVMWARFQEGITCGACHRQSLPENLQMAPQETMISSGL